VLHVLGSLGAGGVETWLANVCGLLDRDQFLIDFALHSAVPGFYEEEVRRRGCRVFRCPLDRRYAGSIMKVLRQCGPYDIVHSHVHFFSGAVLGLARLAGVAGRVAHSHNDTRESNRHASILRSTYLRGMRGLLETCATSGLACSEAAAAALYGEAWREDGRWRLLSYGVDLAAFGDALARQEDARAEFGFAPGHVVVGHVGSFKEQKNHALVVEIARAVCRIDSRARFLLVGEGPLRGEIERRVALAGLGGRVVFTGTRRDVARLMTRAMDVFVFPSLFEGLGLAVVEAQAAGLPVVCSDAVPAEADVVDSLVRRMPAGTPVSRWAELLLQVVREPGCARGAALAAVKASGFNVERSAIELARVYREEAPGE
jgi:glycosyltransferase involved in cell wall biosynthesis